MSFFEHLEPMLLQGDLEGADALLQDLADDRLAEAKRWYGSARSYFGQKYWDIPFAGRVEQDRGRYVDALCAVALCSGSTAAARTPWRWFSEFADRDDPLGQGLLITRLAGVERDWAADFVESVSHRRGALPSWAVPPLATIVRATAEHHGLPAPSGAQFMQAWLGEVRQDLRPLREKSFLERRTAQLTTDPLMPSLLWRYLNSGECGHSPWLPMAVATLIAQGTITRDELATHLVAAMAGPTQRPSSSKVLAQLVTTAGLRGTDIPEGNAQLIPLLSHLPAPLYAVLVPIALELADADDLVELTTLVMGRPEKAVRTKVTRDLTRAAVETQCGRAAVTAALTIASHDADQSIAERAAQHLKRLGVPAAVAEERPAPSLGLWDLPQGPPVTEVELDHVLAEPTHHLRPHATVESFARLATIEPKDATEQFERLFLSGRFRGAWPLALELAAAWSTVDRLPSSFAGFLRMLCGYAPEAPPTPPPAPLVELARRRGSTKAVSEARRLVELLAPERSRTSVSPPRRWVNRPPVPTPGDVRVEPMSDDPRVLREYFADSDFTRRNDPLIFPELLLDAVCRAIGQHGPDTARRCIRTEHLGRRGAMESAIVSWLWDSPADESARTAASRLAERRSSEMLALATENTVAVLATPTWHDGTLDIDDVEDRLARNAGRRVSALDLASALYRLRPTVHTIGPSSCTALVTTRAGESPRSVNVATLVNRWIEAGGLPALSPRPSDGRWTSEARAPLPWSSFPLAPASLDEHGFGLPEPRSRYGRWMWALADDDTNLLRAAPAWADRLAQTTPAATGTTQVPPAVRRPFGLPLHDQLLGAIATLASPESNRLALASEALVGAGRAGAIVPTTMADAAALRSRTGSLELRHLSSVFAAAFDVGGLSDLWHAAVAVIDGALSVDAPTPGLTEFAALLRTNLTAVPEPARQRFEELAPLIDVERMG